MTISAWRHHTLHSGQMRNRLGLLAAVVSSIIQADVCRAVDAPVPLLPVFLGVPWIAGGEF